MMSVEPGGRTIWLVRHGQRQDTNPTWRPRVCHHTEVPLSPVGQAQADALGQRLAGVPIDHLFCSPYLRAVQTASAIVRHTKHPIKIEHGAMEWQNIAWFPKLPPLQSVEELAQQYPAIDTSYKSCVQPVWPETQEQARSRLGQTAKELVRQFEGSILVVGHGLTVVGMAGALLNPPYAAVDDALCGIVRLELRRDRWILRQNGDTDHLTGALRSSLH